MKEKQIKTIDVYGKEWFDKVNGNSYHSVRVVLNYGMPNTKTLVGQFQYGYGSQFIQTASELIREEIGGKESIYPLWSWCESRKIIYRESMQRDCKKRDVVAHGNP